MTRAVLEQKFGGMLHALSLGAPPHGGIAPGIDRIVMLLCGEENLREVVLFPMNQRAEDLMMGAPSEVDGQAIARTAHPRRHARPRLIAARISSFRRHGARPVAQRGEDGREMRRACASSASGGE